MNLPVGGMLVFFALGWSALTLPFDDFIGYPGLRQWTALNYTFTDGTIRSGNIGTSENGDGTNRAKDAFTLIAKRRAHERLVLWSDETQTRGFGTWLATRLRIPSVEG